MHAVGVLMASKIFAGTCVVGASSLGYRLCPSVDGDARFLWVGGGQVAKL